ncbi:MAG: hypothetical protein GYB65_05320, partial [Chloroflexi bacterium]|nr:hypothetical protein [Chloroflexota bacterium]
PGAAVVADSPLSFTLNAISFTLLTPTDFAARLPVALGGVLLVLAPALWRRYLNPLPPLIMSLLLAISPVALLAARTSSPVVWSALLAVVLPWLLLRYVETREPRWAVLTTLSAGVMLLLAEPAGLFMLLSLGFGVAFAWLTEDDPDVDVRGTVQALLREWPWATGALLTALVVVLASTCLFLLPSGLGGVGNVVYEGVTNMFDRQPNAPLAFPLVIALRYEFGLVVFGLVASYHAVRLGGFFERAVTGWFLSGVVWSLVYAGAGAAHALWIVLPLIVLAGLMITRWIVERPETVWNAPYWAVPLHAVITLALWVALAMSLVLLAKWVLFDLPFTVDDLGELVRKLFAGVYSRDTDLASNPQLIALQNTQVYEYVLGFIQLRLLMSVLLSLLISVLYFLVGSIWGARVAWRGLALGTLGAFVLFSLGLGGRAAFQNTTDPREFWYLNPITDDTDELRATLREMSLRATGRQDPDVDVQGGDPYLIEITAQVPEDGALAWALRDFPNTTFVDGVGPEASTAAILAPEMLPEPELGGAYVGKDLVMRKMWDRGTLSWRDALMWYYRGETLYKPLPGATSMLWIDATVYGYEAP